MSDPLPVTTEVILQLVGAGTPQEVKITTNVAEPGPQKGATTPQPAPSFAAGAA